MAQKICLQCGVAFDPRNHHVIVCSFSCRAKRSNSPEVREAKRLKMLGNKFSVGRPKGSKNINPYPVTEAVMARPKPPSWAGKKHSDETREKMSCTRSRIIVERGASVAYRGRFKPVNPQKCVNSPQKEIIYRSSWEMHFMMFLDKNPNVLRWGSESCIIPYNDKTTGRLRRYIPDFIVEMRKADGTIERLLIEIKPSSQSPLHAKISAKRSLSEGAVIAKNMCKWEAATRWASERGMTFRVLTERELGLWRN